MLNSSGKVPNKQSVLVILASFRPLTKCFWIKSLVVKVYSCIPSNLSLRKSYIERTYNMGLSLHHAHGFTRRWYFLSIYMQVRWVWQPAVGCCGHGNQTRPQGLVLQGGRPCMQMPPSPQPSRQMTTYLLKAELTTDLGAGRPWEAVHWLSCRHDSHFLCTLGWLTSKPNWER